MEGFDNFGKSRMIDQFKKNKRSENLLLKKLEERRVCLNEKVFNSGVFVFKTGIIKKNTFDKLMEILYSFSEEILLADQPVLNICFYKKWKSLPIIYNIWPVHYHYYWEKT